METVDTTKYLGVVIQKDAGKEKHINIMCSKVSRALSCFFLQRNLKIGVTRIKALAHLTLVRPIIWYASALWADPHKKKDTD